MTAHSTALTGSRDFGDLVTREEARFGERTPRSRETFEGARRSLIGGVPMPWMLEWPNPYPLYAERARGSRLWDVDGNEYLDFCLGDTGSMFGHSPDAIVEGIQRLIPEGITTMLPSPDAPIVADLLSERFGLPYWQLGMSATDANRFVLRLSRAMTGRPRVLVFHGCYHGSLDESMVLLDGRGDITKRCISDHNPSWPASASSVVVEFNDPDALEAALAEGDVSCVLAEPIMTNCGMVLPDDGYHDALRRLTRQHGTHLIIDETHTLSTGYGGYTREYGLEPDFLVFGKPMAGGIPVGGYGLSQEIADAHDAHFGASPEATWADVGIGGTLTANAFVVSVLRVALEEVATPAAFDHMVRLGGLLAEGLESAIATAGLPWSVTRAGARNEIQFIDHSPRNGTEALAHFDMSLIGYTHLYLANRGMLITPFHNMMLVAPTTTRDDVDTLIDGWAGCMAELAELGA